MHVYEGVMAFLYGALLYPVLELIARGRTHPSMALAGGLAFLFIYFVNTVLRAGNVWLRAAASALFITAVELAVGVVCNLWWGLGVWDYSHLPLSLYGQICLPFTLLWFALSLGAGYLAQRLQKALYA